MKLLLVAAVFFAVFAQALSAPWIQGVDLKLPRTVDPEKPIVAHPSDCHVYYNRNYPMTCGKELVFNPATLACQPAEAVASTRPECANAGGVAAKA